MEELLSPVIKAHPSRKRKIARPDRVPRNPEALEALLHANRNNASRTSSIKDLRMRRVFTPDVNLVLEEDDDDDDHDTETEGGKKLFKASESCRVDCKSERKTALNSRRRRRVFKTSSSFSYRRLFPYMMDILNDSPNVPIIEIVDAVDPCKLPRLDGVKSQKMSFADNSCTAKVKCAVSQLNGTTIPSQNESVAQDEMSRTAEITTPPQQKVCGNVDRVDASVVKECVLKTPPSPAISSHTENGHAGDEAMEKKQKQIKGSEKSSSDTLSHSLSSKHDANSINRSVLKPCSRLRLFDNTKSLSYRRMLPFLINTFQDNPCDSRITQQPMPQVNLKKDTVGENYTNGITTGNTCEKQLTEDQTQNLLSSVVSVPPESNNNNTTIFSMSQPSPPKYSSHGDLHVVTPESPPEPMMPQIDLHTDKMPQSLSDHRKFEFCFDGNRTALQPVQSSINNDILNKQSTSQEPAPVGKQDNPLDKGIELHNNNEEPTDTFDLKQCSFRSKVYDAAMVSPANVSFRGILKRNPRGCRGLCNCLNCASFRLHADRAFEFSRNQMHDAEEVVSGLMKELANLRFLLEKSITCDNDLGAIQLNPVLIKEACYKSLEAETQAKECLSHLNYDLDIHCRTPNFLKPKVTFASNIQERAIPVLDSLASLEKKGRLYEEL